MAHQQLDKAYISAGFEQVRCERVAQGVRRDRLADAGTATCVMARLSHHVGTDGLIREATGKQRNNQYWGRPIHQ